MSQLDIALAHILDRLEACQHRLASAAEETAARAKSYAEGKADPREAAAFHQCGQLEQICRNESAVLRGHIKLLRSATGGAS